MDAAAAVAFGAPHVVGDYFVRILLLIAGTVVGINVLIWLLASLSAGALLYFWPMWVAVGMVIPVVIAFALGRSDD